ncbi:hypothetical protein JNJ66_05410 [Candidatus Saccharibacteria bacterium]|nr:hypothetical protein [Candidatus Saccharibacteria bacterium]
MSKPRILTIRETGTNPEFGDPRADPARAIHDVDLLCAFVLPGGDTGMTAGRPQDSDPAWLFYHEGDDYVVAEGEAVRSGRQVISITSGMTIDLDRCDATRLILLIASNATGGQITMVMEGFSDSIDIRQGVIVLGEVIGGERFERRPQQMHFTDLQAALEAYGFTVQNPT